MRLNNKDDLQYLRERFNVVMNTEFPNLRVKLGCFTYEPNGNNATARVEFIAGKSNGEQALDRACTTYSMDKERIVCLPDGFGRNLGEKAKLVEFKTRAPKYPWVIQVLTGPYKDKKYKIGYVTAKALFGETCDD